MNQVGIISHNSLWLLSEWNRITSYNVCYTKLLRAISLEEDILNLKTKVDAGADFLITQLFFINELYYQFVAMARETGINQRIIPGIIPLTSYAQIERFTKMSAATIPDELRDKIETYKNNPPKMYQAGIDFTISQCKDLLDNGAPVV